MAKLKALTVKERILVATSAYNKVSDQFVAPRAVTQDGIAATLGIARAHASIELKALVKSGQVEERLQHVEGQPRQLLVYFPTPAGMQHVTRIRSSVEVPVESLVFATPTKIIRRRELSKDLKDMRERLERLEARARAEGWL